MRIWTNSSNMASAVVQPIVDQSENFVLTINDTHYCVDVRLFIIEKVTRGIKSYSDGNPDGDIQLYTETWEKIENDLSLSNDPQFRDNIRAIIESHMGYPNPRLKLFLSSYRFLAKYERSENYPQPYILGFCMEMVLKSSMLIQDCFNTSNYEQNMQIWLGKQCNNVEKITLSTILETGVQNLMRNSYNKHGNFNLMNSILQNSKLKLLAWKLSTYPEKSIKSFDERAFDRAIVDGVAFQNFEMPIVLAILSAEQSENIGTNEYRNIFHLLGKIYQIRDDFSDFELGELGYDIEDNKCTWLITQALKMASPTQRKILEECYGVNDVEKAAKVRQIYQQLNIHTQYPIVEKIIYEEIRSELKKIPAGSVYDMMDNIVGKCFSERE